MVAEITTTGWILSTSSRRTAQLDEVVAYCGWPVFVEATPRRISRELALQTPRLALFWIDDAEQVAATARLVAWLCSCQPAIKRVAVACELAAATELQLRAAGAHAFLSIWGNVGAALESSLAPLLDGLLIPADPPAAAPHRGDRSRASPAMPRVHRSRSP